MTKYKAEFDTLSEKLDKQGLNVGSIINALKAQHIETPSWGYANSGTRFQTFSWPGAAATTRQKIDDAAMVQKMTGIARSVALHIPWDIPEDGDYSGLRQYAESKGVQIGAINPNVFQDAVYRLGSLGNPDPAVQAKSLEHILECCDIMEKVGSRNLSLWFADGTNYAGQDNLGERKQRFESGLKQVYAKLPENGRILLEYKFFEPAFYSTDIPDWGTAYAFCTKLGENAQVLVDLGHHAQGVNIEQIVTFLLYEGKLGGFHFNNRRYADDDLMVGSVNPYELFLIYNELTTAELTMKEPAHTTAKNVAYMIDQSHNIEGKVLPMIYSVTNCQIAYAKSLLVDRKRLENLQRNGAIMEAHHLVNCAYQTDVTPLLAEARREMGCPEDPVEAYLQSGYEDKIKKERGIAKSAGGYQS
ncbi:MAG: L-rhamnose isomerase [Calditrichales bacterium]|nr:MAG: L-rhamnose isomerase [Calditrichales bacterium]